MNLEDILECGSIDETIAFFSTFIPTIYNHDYKKDNVESYIDFNKLTERVHQSPSLYIDLTCVPVAEELRKKNIFAIGTLKTSEYLYLLLDKLNSENMKIFREKHKSNNVNFFMNYRNLDYFGFRISTKYKKNVSNKFLKLAEDFKMQDIQRGFFSEKNFLMHICACEKVEGLKEYEKNNAKIVFDVQKMDKSFRQYLKDSGYEQYYLQNEHRVYLNDFYYNAHQNYLKELKK